MDTLLSQGDHKRNGQGFLTPISGAQEAIQRAMIRLSVPKGSFAPNPKLGSRLFLLGKAPERQTEELALEYAKEALLEEEQVQATAVRQTERSQGSMELEIMLSYLGEDSEEGAQYAVRLHF